MGTGVQGLLVQCGETPNGEGVRPASLYVLLSRTSPEALQEDQQNRSLGRGMAEVWGPHCLTLAVSEEPIPHAEGGNCCQVTVASLSMSPGSDEQQVWLWMAWTQTSQSMWPDQRHHRDNKELLNFGSHLSLHPHQIHFSCLFPHLGPAHRSTV